MPQVPSLKPDGAAIKARRLKLGLRPEDVIARINRQSEPPRHPQTIRRIERGAITTAGETLVHQIALALELDDPSLIILSGDAA